MKIVPYHHNHQIEWNQFIAVSKNGLFFFHTDFLFYHADRFKDASLLIYNEANDLLAVFPANTKDGVVYSHQGLTYGGLIYGKKTKAIEVLHVLEAIVEYYKSKGIEKIVYKPIPYIFSSLPAQEDLYALFRLKAQLIRRDISSIIDLQHKIEFSPTKKNLVNRAHKTGIVIRKSDDWAAYWTLLSAVLQKYNTLPVHSLAEITMLHNAFPENIQLFIAEQNEVLLAGIVIFKFGQVIHTQYMANTDAGRKIGALDVINYTLINDVFPDASYYSFGISNEQNGWYLNEGLIQQKELMGGRGMVIDVYEITV